MDAENPNSYLCASMAGTIPTSVSQPQADIAYASAVSTLGRELRRGNTLGLAGAKNKHSIWKTQRVGEALVKVAVWRGSIHSASPSVVSKLLVLG